MEEKEAQSAEPKEIEPGQPSPDKANKSKKVAVRSDDNYEVEVKVKVKVKKEVSNDDLTNAFRKLWGNLGDNRIANKERRLRPGSDFQQDIEINFESKDANSPEYLAELGELCESLDLALQQFGYAASSPDALQRMVLAVFAELDKRYESSFRGPVTQYSFHLEVKQRPKPTTREELELCKTTPSSWRPVPQPNVDYWLSF